MSAFLGLLVALALALGYTLAAYFLQPRRGSWGWWRPFLVGLSGTCLSGIVLILLTVAVWPPFGPVSILALAVLAAPVIAIYLSSRKEGGQGGQTLDSYDAELRSGTGA